MRDNDPQRGWIFMGVVDFLELPSPTSPKFNILPTVALRSNTQHTNLRRLTCRLSAQ